MRGCKEAEALKFPAARVKKMMLADDDVRRAPLRRLCRAFANLYPHPHCYADYVLSGTHVNARRAWKGIAGVATVLPCKNQLAALFARS